MKKHDIDPEDNQPIETSGSGLDRKHFDALTRRDDQSGIFTWRGEEPGEIRTIVVLVPVAQCLLSLLVVVVYHVYRLPVTSYRPPSFQTACC